MRPILQDRLPPDLVGQAAGLYWQAFGGKLGRVLGPDRLALDYLARVIRCDHAMVALDGAGRLIGLVGFKTPSGAFAAGGWADLRLTYGRLGSLWRGALLRALSQDIDNERFLIDGICVDMAHRSQGVGAALLAAVEVEAKARGYGAIRLDVIDTNWRARALYERQGYQVIRRQALGPLRWIFGFRAALTMVKAI